MKNMKVVIWYDLYFFLKFQLVISQIQRKVHQPMTLVTNNHAMEEPGIAICC